MLDATEEQRKVAVSNCYFADARWIEALSQFERAVLEVW